MTGKTAKAKNDVEARWRALSRWDNEGGAGARNPHLSPAIDKAEIGRFKLTNVESPRTASLEGSRADFVLERPMASEQIGMVRQNYPKFTNDHGVRQIRIGVKAFKCIGASPPQDHPHIFLEIRGQDDGILCPYCATRFRFDPDLDPFAADPVGSVFALGDDAEGV